MTPQQPPRAPPPVNQRDLMLVLKILSGIGCFGLVLCLGFAYFVASICKGVGKY